MVSSMSPSPRISLALASLYNLKSAHPRQVQGHNDAISPLSSVQATPHEDEKQAIMFSPAMTTTTTVSYFPDDKIVMPIEEGLEASPRRESAATGLEVGNDPNGEPPQYTSPHAEAELPDRPQRKSFIKRHWIWLSIIALLLAILIAVVAGIMGHKPKSDNKTTTVASVIPNNTMNSVASSGLFLKDGTTWNMHLFTQNTTGDINLRLSLDGTTYTAAQKVTLTIPAKVGSPLSATAEQDEDTGVIMINLFYLSGNTTQSNITMSAITCASGSSVCHTINNCLLPTTVPPSVYTGLTAVNVNDAQDWRVYYLDQQGFVSQLQGNSSGFDFGEPIGGSGLNSSSLAAVNANSTTNNIRLFYVDYLTQQLFNMQFTASAWTTPQVVSPDLITSWNPLSGLGAAISNATDQLHVYYTGNDLGIYELVGSNASLTTNTTWAPQPGRNHIWAEADFIGADISAVGWKNQVRFYQEKTGKVAEGALSATTWTEAFIGP